MPAPARNDTPHRLPWDDRGYCSDEDVEREDLPLYHEVAIEAWVLEHPAASGSHLHEGSIAAIAIEVHTDRWPAS
jgi:hypothetical protein